MYSLYRIKSYYVNLWMGHPVYLVDIRTYDEVYVFMYAYHTRNKFTILRIKVL